MIKIWTDEVMRGSGKDSRGRFLIKRGAEIDSRGVREAVEGAERHFRPSKMNNRGAGDVNRGVKTSIEGSNDQLRGQKINRGVANNGPRWSPFFGPTPKPLNLRSLRRPEVPNRVPATAG